MTLSKFARIVGFARMGGGSGGSWRGAFRIAQGQIPARVAGHGELGRGFPSELRVWSCVVVTARQHSRATRTWASDVNSVSLNNSSCSRPLKLSMSAWVCPARCSTIRRRPSQDGVSAEFAAVSLTIIFGLPHSIISRSSSRATRVPERGRPPARGSRGYIHRPRSGCGSGGRRSADPTQSRRSHTANKTAATAARICGQPVKPFDRCMQQRGIGLGGRYSGFGSVHRHPFETACAQQPVLWATLKFSASKSSSSDFGTESCPAIRGN